MATAPKTPADPPAEAAPEATPADDSPVMDGTSFYGGASAADRVPLAGMFQADQSLLSKEQSLNEWKQALADFLAAPANA